MKPLYAPKQRVKADWDHPCGLPVHGPLGSNGVAVDFAAEGFFAVRCERGEIAAVAAGGLTRLEGPGLSLRLERPEDVAFIKIDGEWRGVWQTAERDASLDSPAAAGTAAAARRHFDTSTQSQRLEKMIRP
ncbi:MAG: hypothetical protein J6T01_06550 [Kiritimatiellae bacterium]|nr:hypothetical protein [Kiritimatiellia bacterium]